MLLLRREGELIEPAVQPYLECFVRDTGAVHARPHLRQVISSLPTSPRITRSTTVDADERHEGHRGRATAAIDRVRRPEGRFNMSELSS
jgi:hypothetical protein